MQQLSLSYKNIIPVSDTDTLQLQKLYIALRQKENRVYSNDELLMLPDVNKHHVYRKEWRIRKYSCNRLLRYLKHKKKALRILEVGCGNGWLSNQLSRLDQVDVTGLDINIMELKQARCVFGHKSNLHFQQGDIRDCVLDKEKFDQIIFAASIQYFPSVSAIISRSELLLSNDGEIHILDSMFYTDLDVRHAKARSDAYFEKLGFPEMSGLYFHHTFSTLEKLNYRILSRPAVGLKNIFSVKRPFYWMVINPRTR